MASTLTVSFKAAWAEPFCKLYRGDHELPHQSQLLYEDLDARDLLRWRGKTTQAFMRHPDDMERSIPPREYQYLIYVPESGLTSWTAFHTETELRTWVDAYGLKITSELVPGKQFSIYIPKHPRMQKLHIVCDFKTPDQQEAAVALDWALQQATTAAQLRRLHAIQREFYAKGVLPIQLLVAWSGANVEGDRRITTSFTRTYPSEPDEYPEEEHGWVNEEGVSMEPDDDEIKEGITAADKAIKFLRYEYATEKGNETDYYTTGDVDFSTGADTTRMCRLHGFTKWELSAIAGAMTTIRYR